MTYNDPYQPIGDEYAELLAKPKQPLSDAQKARNKESSRNAKRKNREMHRTLFGGEKPFIAFDGEGWDDLDNPVMDKYGPWYTHKYRLLSAMCSTDMQYHYIENLDGLTFGQIMQFITEITHQYGGIPIFYGGSYDFNMILKTAYDGGITSGFDRLAKGQRAYIGPYIIDYRPRKAFWFRHREDMKKGIQIYDTITFFQTSFVNACDAYLGTNWEGREAVIADKAKRGTFETVDPAHVREYNRLELRNFLALMATLKSHLRNANLEPTRWDGPGAVAAKLLTKLGVKEMVTKCPDPVAKAARHAYAGGRFEVIQFGQTPGEAWQYDVNSAYPAAYRELPRINEGTWKHHINPKKWTKEKYHNFSLYCVNVDCLKDNEHLPCPVLMRNAKGNTGFPGSVHTWIWSPEMETLDMYVKQMGGMYTISEVWEFIPDNPQDYPFQDEVNKLFATRLEMKAAGDGTEKAIKLALNSMYGKTVQQVGWKQRGTPPPFHQLEYGGYITSYCRAAMMKAALQNMEAVIAFETDAIFLSAPIDLPVSKWLGDYDMTHYKTLTYCQSGIYFGEMYLPDGTTKMVEKTRGVPRGKLHYDDFRKTLYEYQFGLPDVDVDLPSVQVDICQFITMNEALSWGTDYRWTCWKDAIKTIRLCPHGKRVIADSRLTNTMQPHTLYRTLPNFTQYNTVDTPFSVEFPVEWIASSTQCDFVDEFAEYREGHKEYDGIVR